jgi:hypothetical protein
MHIKSYYRKWIYRIHRGPPCFSVITFYRYILSLIQVSKSTLNSAPFYTHQGHNVKKTNFGPLYIYIYIYIYFMDQKSMTFPKKVQLIKKKLFFYFPYVLWNTTHIHLTFGLVPTSTHSSVCECTVLVQCSPFFLFF